MLLRVEFMYMSTYTYIHTLKKRTKTHLYIFRCMHERMCIYLYVLTYMICIYIYIYIFNDRRASWPRRQHPSVCMCVCV
jgi:hypothetical protein